MNIVSRTQQGSPKAVSSKLYPLDIAELVGVLLVSSHVQNNGLKSWCLVEKYVNSLKVGQNCGSDPSLRKNSIKSLLAHQVLESTLKFGDKLWDILFSPLKL